MCDRYHRCDRWKKTFSNRCDHLENHFSAIVVKCGFHLITTIAERFFSDCCGGSDGSDHIETSP